MQKYEDQTTEEFIHTAHAGHEEEHAVAAH
jgi:hypothetical protein